MVNTHANAVLILGKPFADDEVCGAHSYCCSPLMCGSQPFDFYNQNMTADIHALIPSMIEVGWRLELVVLNAAAHSRTRAAKRHHQMNHTRCTERWPVPFYYAAG